MVAIGQQCRTDESIFITAKCFKRDQNRNFCLMLFIFVHSALEESVCHKPMNLTTHQLQYVINKSSVTNHCIPLNS